MWLFAIGIWILIQLFQISSQICTDIIIYINPLTPPISHVVAVIYPLSIHHNFSIKQSFQKCVFDIFLDQKWTFVTISSSNFLTHTLFQFRFDRWHLALWPQIFLKVFVQKSHVSGLNVFYFGVKVFGRLFCRVRFFFRFISNIYFKLSPNRFINNS